MLNLDDFFKPITDAIIQVPNFAEIGILIVFALAVIPFMPIPAEPIVIPLALAVDEAERENLIWSLALLIGIGAFISHLIVYYLSREHLHKIIKRPNALTKNHWFHRYGVWTMLGIPSGSIFIPPLADSFMVVLGHYRANKMKLFSVIFVGELIRAYFIGIMLINLL